MDAIAPFTYGGSETTEANQAEAVSALEDGRVVLLKDLNFQLTAGEQALFGSGLGEIMFLSMSSHFDPNVISTWSSGTGLIGISYMNLIQSDSL